MGSFNDVLGLMMHGLVSFLFVVCLVLVPVFTYFNLDPTYYILEELFPTENMISNLIKLVVRIIVLQWAVVEAARSLLIMFLPAVSIFNLVISCINIISRQNPNEETLVLYSRLQCVVQFAFEGVREGAGILMGTGFLLGVLGTWTIVKGWQLLPLPLYCILSVLTVVIYTVVWQTLPRICNCNRSSYKMLKIRWPVKDIAYWKEKLGREDIGRSLRYRSWKRYLEAQRPVTWYYGTAAFDEDTTANFCQNIVDQAMSLILVT